MSKNVLLSIALASVVAAAPAGAIDLTGSWEGSYACSRFNNGVADKLKVKPSLLEIVQTDATLTASIDGVQAYNGATIDLTADPTKRGEAILNTCGIGRGR